MAHSEACQVYIEQEIEEGLKSGKKPGAIGKELSKWVEKLFEAKIPHRTIEQRARRTGNATNVANNNNNNLEEYEEEDRQVEESDAQPAPEAPKPQAIVFNETNENIDWARWTWNPVTGCEHGCQYCYARDIANRFFRTKFKPTFYPHRLAAPKNTTVPQETNGKHRNVFVCSMADLFGSWVPDAWIEKTLKAVVDNPQWNFIFLTKNPERLTQIDWPKNTKVGTTVDVQSRVDRAQEAFERINAPVKFLSCEPLLEGLVFDDLSMFDCVIIGAQSRSSKCPEFQPQKAWVIDLLLQADSADCRIFLKPNLTVFKDAP
jgi:protein gp37